jgi:mRNA interferase MazF
MSRTLRRGDVWRLAMPEPTGSEPGSAHWGLVVAGDGHLASAIQTVTLAVITSQLERAKDPGNVTLAPPDSGLDRVSVVNVSQVATVDRSMLGQLMGTVPKHVMETVDDGLLMALGLDDAWAHDRDPDHAATACLRRAMSVMHNLVQDMKEAGSPAQLVASAEEAIHALDYCLESSGGLQ